MNVLTALRIWNGKQKCTIKELSPKCNLLTVLFFSILDADLFLGLKMLSSPNHWMVKTMGGFVGWEAFIAITLDINLWLKKRGTSLILIHTCHCLFPVFTKAAKQSRVNNVPVFYIFRNL